MAAGCPFITCALKKEQVEFCWDCQKNAGCMKWNSHREAGKNADSFKCYQGLEKDIAAVQKRGIGPLVKEQDEREAILRLMLAGFNEGRSKSYYCIATTVMAVDELRDALSRAQDRAAGLDMKAKSEMLHSILDETARKKGYLLKLRK